MNVETHEGGGCTREIAFITKVCSPTCSPGTPKVVHFGMLTDDNDGNKLGGSGEIVKRYVTVRKALTRSLFTDS